MRKRSVFKFLLPGLVLLSVVATSTGVFTYAAFSVAGEVTQQAGYSGSLKKTIYLNANVWNIDNAIFYLWDGTNSRWIAPSKTIEQRVYYSDGSGFAKLDLTCFEINVSDTGGEGNNPVAQFNLARINPNYAGDVPSWDACWNQTNNIYENASFNYYVINGWEQTSYKKNNIYINNSDQMQFSGSDV